jgi:hypothetical protein
MLSSRECELEWGRHVCKFELKEDVARAIVVHIFRVVAISTADKSNSGGAHYDVHKIVWAHALVPSLFARVVLKAWPVLTWPVLNIFSNLKV